MAPLKTADHAAPPRWFVTALSAPAERGTVIVDAAAISYRAWGDRGADGLVLVHGGAAHARWWDHIAPLLAVGRRVVALDLSGHGDSGHRDAYGLDLWARETLAVAADAGIGGPAIVIGHSMGGAVALRAAGLYSSLLAGAVAIDTFVQDATPRDNFDPLPVYAWR